MIDPLSAPSFPTESTVGAHCPPLDEERGNYRVRFARGAEDVEACCRMRFEVFHAELQEGLSRTEGAELDLDAFDQHCNHLMVIDTGSSAVVGTYRMQTAEMARAGGGLYSAAEFDLGGLPSEFIEAGIELGRACIVQEHRNKVVLFLLWRGLMAYLLWNDKRYLFGCSSISSQDPCDGRWAFDHLARQGHVQREWLCRTLPAYTCDVTSCKPNPEPYPIPSLFSTYLRHGAKICSLPALDRTFGTIDFLTLLDKEKFHKRLAAVFAADLPRR